MERRGNLVKSFEIQRNVIGLVMILIQGIAVFGFFHFGNTPFQFGLDFQLTQGDL